MAYVAQKDQKLQPVQDVCRVVIFEKPDFREALPFVSVRSLRFGVQMTNRNELWRTQHDVRIKKNHAY